MGEQTCHHTMLNLACYRIHSQFTHSTHLVINYILADQSSLIMYYVVMRYVISSPTPHGVECNPLSLLVVLTNVLCAVIMYVCNPLTLPVLLTNVYYAV